MLALTLGGREAHAEPESRFDLAGLDGIDYAGPWRTNAVRWTPTADAGSGFLPITRAAEWRLNTRLSLVAYSVWASEGRCSVWPCPTAAVEPQLGVLLKYQLTPQTYGGVDFRQRRLVEPAQSRLTTELRAVLGGAW